MLAHHKETGWSSWAAGGAAWEGTGLTGVRCHLHTSIPLRCDCFSERRFPLGRAVDT